SLSCRSTRSASGGVMNGPNSIAKRAPDVGSLPVDIDGTGFTGIGGAATTGGWTTIVGPAGEGGVAGRAPRGAAGGRGDRGDGGRRGRRARRLGTEREGRPERRGGAGRRSFPWEHRRRLEALAQELLRARSAAEPAQAPACERTQRAHERDDEQRQRDWVGS